MNEKLINLDDPEEETTGFQPGWRSRRIDLPAHLDKLFLLPVEEVDRMIRTEGAALGYSVILRLAAGYGETPATTQMVAARFLVERGGETAAAEQNRHVGTDTLRQLGRQTLLDMIARLEAELLIEGKTEKLSISSDN